MQITRDQIDVLYRRYSIVDEAMLKEGAENLQILHDTLQSPASKVVSVTDATSSRGVRSSTGRVRRTARGKVSTWAES